MCATRGAAKEVPTLAEKRRRKYSLFIETIESSFSSRVPVIRPSYARLPPKSHSSGFVLPPNPRPRTCKRRRPTLPGNSPQRNVLLTCAHWQPIGMGQRSDCKNDRSSRRLDNFGLVVQKVSGIPLHMCIHWLSCIWLVYGKLPADTTITTLRSRANVFRIAAQGLTFPSPIWQVVVSQRKVKDPAPVRFPEIPNCVSHLSRNQSAVVEPTVLVKDSCTVKPEAGNKSTSRNASLNITIQCNPTYKRPMPVIIGAVAKSQGNRHSFAHSRGTMDARQLNRRQELQSAARRRSPRTAGKSCNSLLLLPLLPGSVGEADRAVQQNRAPTRARARR